MFNNKKNDEFAKNSDHDIALMEKCNNVIFSCKTDHHKKTCINYLRLAEKKAKLPNTVMLLKRWIGRTKFSMVRGK